MTKIQINFHNHTNNFLFKKSDFVEFTSKLHQTEATFYRKNISTPTYITIEGFNAVTGQIQFNFDNYVEEINV